ncbi:hypothetical protein BDZ97DRAFT_2057488 [Flammula alnicola]|nr:hypothetical protein BDZ97DRAFT_2057488 [Flammula alnicola]
MACSSPPRWVGQSHVCMPVVEGRCAERVMAMDRYRTRSKPPTVGGRDVREVPLTICADLYSRKASFLIGVTHLKLHDIPPIIAISAPEFLEVLRRAVIGITSRREEYVSATVKTSHLRTLHLASGIDNAANVLSGIVVSPTVTMELETWAQTFGTLLALAVHPHRVWDYTLFRRIGIRSIGFAIRFLSLGTLPSPESISISDSWDDLHEDPFDSLIQRLIERYELGAEIRLLVLKDFSTLSLRLDLASGSGCKC